MTSALALFEADLEAALGLCDPAARAATLDVLAKHLPGKHDQSTHGHGGGALTGQAALDAVPTEYRSGPQAHFGNYEGAVFTAPEGAGDPKAIQEYEGVEYQVTNSYLRHGPLEDRLAGQPVHEPEGVRRQDAETAHRVAEIDKTMAVSPTAATVQVHRVVMDGSSVFGQTWHEGVINRSTKDFDAQDREYERWLAGDRPNLTGASWTDRGYTSTTANPAYAQAFGERWARTAREMPDSAGEPVMMKITVPAGTGAIQLGGMGTTTGPGGRTILNSAELMLQRDLTFTVTADHGVDADGFRQLDVEASR